MTAAHALNETIVPWFDSQDVRLLRVTDRGTEYCGKVEHHAYQLFLALEDIDHSKTKARHPQTNGICERFHRTMKEEFYDIAFRKKIYSSLEQLQNDVDEWLLHYNQLRPHSGKHCYGSTPMQTFLDGKSIAQEKNLDNYQSPAKNIMELSKQDDAWIEASSDFGSKSPSTEFIQGEILQGDYLKEQQKNA